MKWEALDNDERGTDQADDGRESGMHFGDAALYASGQVMQKKVQRAMHTTGHDLQSMLAGVATIGQSGRGGQVGRMQRVRKER